MRQVVFLTFLLMKISKLFLISFLHVRITTTTSPSNEGHVLKTDHLCHKLYFVCIYIRTIFVYFFSVTVKASVCQYTLL